MHNAVLSYIILNHLISTKARSSSAKGLLESKLISIILVEEIIGAALAKGRLPV